MIDPTLVFSLFSLGFFGGFSHCSFMCGPFVLAQTQNRLEKIPLENFSNFSRLNNSALLPYHLGRITTYSLIGFFCSFLGESLRNFGNFKIVSALILSLAALFFLKIFLEGLPFIINQIQPTVKFDTNRATTHQMNSRPGNKFYFFRAKNFLSWLPNLVRTLLNHHLLNFLFKNPEGWKGYFLGTLLGFIPCGLLYGAFLTATMIENPLTAMLAMIIFGIGTFPALFLTASGGAIFFRQLWFKILSKIILLINAFILFSMALNLLF
jgi:sulfite exporter TauE/SafE